MRRALVVLMVVAVMPFLTAAVAEAQEMQEVVDLTTRHQVSGMVGYQIFDITDELHDAGVEVKQEISFDGRYEYRLTPNWGIEGFLSYSPATLWGQVTTWSNRRLPKSPASYFPASFFSAAAPLSGFFAGSACSGIGTSSGTKSYSGAISSSTHAR